MTGYMVVDKNGEAVSVGTVLADPLPKGMNAVKLSDVDYRALVDGEALWDAKAQAVALRYVEPTVAEQLQSEVAKLDDPDQRDLIAALIEQL